MKQKQTEKCLFQMQECAKEIKSKLDEAIEVIDAISHELGVPQPGYPAPVANAACLAREFLEKVRGK